MTKENLKIAVVGGGSIGRVLSILLLTQGYDVEMVCRDNHRAIKIDNSYAYEIQGDFGNKSYLVPFVTSIEKLSSKKDIIILATKSFDTLKRSPKCLSKLTPKGTIVTIQNVYTIDKLINLIPRECTVCMICDFACTKIDKVTYVKNSRGVTLGVYHPKAINRMKLVSRVLADIMDVYITKDIVGFAMGRNIINGTIAVLGAVSGMKLKHILEDRNGRYLFCKTIKEAYNVCKRFKINVIPYNYQLDYEKFTQSGLKGALYRNKIMGILRKYNGNVKSSALNNIENGEETEIRQLCDCIIAYAKKSKTDIPYIKTLSEMLFEIEKGKRRVNDNAFYDEKLLKLEGVKKRK